jgi:hypothetical protein
VPPQLAARLRRWLPWIVGVAIIVVVASRLPYQKFQASLSHGPHLALALTEIAITLTVLVTDSLSTWVGLIALKIRWPLARVAAVRGVTYLLFLINYAVGQGGFGYYLHKAGEPPLRAAGATLFLIGTNLACLLLLTLAVWIGIDARGDNPALWWTLVIGSAGFAAYLVVIALRFPVLAQRQLLAPLFEAGLRGHALAVVGRLPHVVVIVLSYWVAMEVWGIHVPFATAATLMPAVALAAVLPISPAGLGTTQAALVYFFRDYAAGATADDRSAAVLAFGIVHFVYGVGAAVLVGGACVPFAKRMGALTSPDLKPAPPVTTARRM